MAEPAKSSPLSELRIALPSLPMRLQEVGRFVAANDYDATTRSMRDLAAEAGADPAAFTRLAKAIGYSGWDELRAALTEARRPSQTSPFWLAEGELISGLLSFIDRDCAAGPNPRRRPSLSG